VGSESPNYLKGGIGKLRGSFGKRKTLDSWRRRNAGGREANGT